ncbi:MAG TPA: hypothetical protein VLK57_05490 [Pseudonocardia sp.]|nr:hypothetical protein [Pseudonocardia sp.]
MPAIEEQPYERALAQWDDGSSDALLAALPLLDELDARAVAARVRGRLRELGVTGLPRGRSPATRANLGGLTGRQLDVLTPLTEGLSNADIAATGDLAQDGGSPRVGDPRQARRPIARGGGGGRAPTRAGAVAPLRRADLHVGARLEPRGGVFGS